MRWPIIRTLFVKEVRRHFANRGGIALALLLIVAAVLLSVFNPTAADAGAPTGGDLVGGVHHCYVEFVEETPLIQALKKKVPPNLEAQLYFRKRDRDTIQTLVIDAPGTGTLRILEQQTEHGPVLGFELWHPPNDPGAMAGYEAWLYRAAREALQEMATAKLKTAGVDNPDLPPLPPESDDLWAVRDSFENLRRDVIRLQATAPTPTPNAPDWVPQVLIARRGIGAKPLDFRSAIATAMVVFALYFTCCYLLPTLNCEERERGVLLAQALSPASPAELVIAKFLFYPVVGVGLAAILAGIYNPEVLNTVFFWLAILAMAMGFLGIGMTVSTLAKTQRSAFMGSMCYLMSVSLLLFICSQNAIPILPQLAIEFHGPKILHAALTRNVEGHHWIHLLATFGLGALWMTAAGWLFRKRGWQ